MTCKRPWNTLFYPGFLYFEGSKEIPVWCAQSIAAFNKCKWVSREHPNKMNCILGLGEEDCYKKIASGLADLSAFDGGSIFDAGEHNNYAGK